MMQSLFEGLNCSPLNKVTFLYLLTDSTGLVVKRELSADHLRANLQALVLVDIEGCRKVRHKCFMVAVGLMKI